MVFAMRGYDAVIGFPRGGDVVSYLPMAHIAERNCSHYFPMGFGFRVTCCPDAREVIAYLPEVRPAWFFAVPRICEKLKAALQARGGEDLRRAIGPATRRPAGLRERLGLDRAQAVNVGAAPTPPEVIEFFHVDRPPARRAVGDERDDRDRRRATRRGRSRSAPSGRPSRACEIRLAEDGEVEVRGAMRHAPATAAAPT